MSPYFCHRKQRNISRVVLKGQGQKLTSGQGHVVTQVDHDAIYSMRLGHTDLFFDQKLCLTYDREWSEGKVNGLKLHLGHPEWLNAYKKLYILLK